MQIVIMRHAQAIELGSHGVTEDEDRFLTEEGRLQAIEMAKSLLNKGIRIDGLISSPLIRARQTAELVAEIYGIARDSIQTTNHLAPGLRCKRLARFMRQHASDHVAIFGHEPDLGIFTGWLIGSKAARVTFAKGGVACLEADDDIQRSSAELQWLVTPAWGRPG